MTNFRIIFLIIYCIAHTVDSQINSYTGIMIQNLINNIFYNLLNIIYVICIDINYIYELKYKIKSLKYNNKHVAIL